MGKITLLLGGARSGKSRHAQAWAEERSSNLLFVATAQAFDDEMRQRIAKHRQDRGATWRTLEAPLGTGAAVQAVLSESPAEVVVLDCMTLLASNAMLALPEDSTTENVAAAVLFEVDAILATCRSHAADWLIVSNEVGMGIVPMTRMGRDYRDALGAANQRLAHAADDVYLFVAGIPWRLK